MVLLAMCARKRNGKDTFADILVEKHGFHKLSFAYALKESSKILFGFTDEDLEEDKEKIHPFWKTTPRKVLQYVGTELFRERIKEVIPWVGDNFWVEKLKQSYLKLQEKHGKNVNVIITDCRFLNEGTAVHKMDGYIIGVVRPSIKSKDAHASEKEIDLIKKDYLVINDGTINELHKKALQIFNEIK